MNSDAKITVTLTHSQWEEIENAVLQHRDCGPDDEGWKSDELKAAGDALDEALKVARANTTMSHAPESPSTLSVEAPSEQQAQQARSAPVPGSAIMVRLPKEQVLTILSRAVNEHASLADLLKFNVEHEQWDLILQHLGTMAKCKTIIETCAAALLPNNEVSR